jgi:hypothetical protein
MNSLEYEELPLELRLVLNRELFLTAYATKIPNNIVLWVINSNVKEQCEIEFLISENRFLSDAERMLAFPPESIVVLPDMDVQVSVTYKMKEKSSVVLEVYRIFSLDKKDFLTEVEKTYYFPFKDKVADLVKEALEVFRFPEVYKNWSDVEKVDYWVRLIYRIRRQNVEYGASENDVFDSTLIDKMIKLDSSIRHILPEILKSLAGIEQMKVTELISMFKKKTGFDF